MKTIKYKGYEGTADVDMEDFVCRGKILFIDDLVTYQACSPADLEKEFHAAVDDYLETCDLLGREPKKPLKGQFNVRISPDLHKKAVLRGIEDGTNLNKVVAKALEGYLNNTVDINNNLTVTIKREGEKVQTEAVTSSSVPKWSDMSYVN